MKNIKKIIALITIAIVIQHIIFLYLENVYCSTDIDTRAERVETKEYKNNDKMEITIKSGVNNITVSSDGRFVAYLDNGKLKVLNSSDNTEKEFENIYNSEERYSGEGAITQTSDESNDKNTTKNNKSAEVKSTDSSKIKEEENKKEDQSKNNTTVKNPNINESGNSDGNASSPNGNVDKPIDIPEENNKKEPVTEMPGNSGVGPWNDTSIDNSLNGSESIDGSVNTTGPGSINGPGSTGVGPWNDNNSTEKPNMHSGDLKEQKSTSRQESIEIQKNITDNTATNRTTNINPMLLSTTNTLGNTVENIKLLAKQDITKNANTIDAEIVFYKWLPNESNMIVIRKIKENGSYYFEPISFDAKKGKVRELADFNLNRIRIELQSEDDKVDDVAFSTYSNSLYIKIKKANGNNSLYYVNVMNELERVKYNTAIGKVVVPTTNANAVIEENSEIKILNNGEVLIPNVKNPKILGSDSSDNVYFGEIINGKINKIYYTVLSDKNRIWNKFVLAKPVEQEDIIIDYSGKVYINNKIDNSVLELTTNQTISYNGSLLQSYSKGIIIKSENTLLKINIKEE